MEVYYGYNDHYINITKQVFEKCISDKGILIPSGEDARCKLIGFDPFPNILKHIIIIDYNKNKHIYHFTKEVEITFESISEQLTDMNNPKQWWNKVGKWITDPIERLNTLQKRFNLHYISWGGGFEFEYPEQLMAIRFINENAKVLEIGGNIGRTSHIIHTILSNPMNHVIMECDMDMAQKLRYNLDMNSYTKARIETAALSKSRLYMDRDRVQPLDDKETRHPNEIPTISYDQLCKKYQIEFDTLVADCEGSLYYIFKEDPDMLNHINLVIMENDYTVLDHKKMVDSILTTKGFHCIYREKGVPAAYWSCCYEYFYEVWSK